MSRREQEEAQRSWRRSSACPSACIVDCRALPRNSQKKEPCMKRMTLLVSFLALSTGFAADMPQPELFLVHEEIIKPSGMMAYEASARDFLTTVAEKKVSSPMMQWSAATTSDMHYIYIFPIDSFASLDSSQMEWAKARETVGAPRWDEISKHSNDAMASFNEFIVMRRPDL